MKKSPISSEKEFIGGVVDNFACHAKNIYDLSRFHKTLNARIFGSCQPLKF